MDNKETNLTILSSPSSRDSSLVPSTTHHEENGGPLQQSPRREQLQESLDEDVDLFTRGLTSTTRQQLGALPLLIMRPENHEPFHFPPSAVRHLSSRDRFHKKFLLETIDAVLLICEEGVVLDAIDHA